jgi:hypothetical protein
MNGVWILAGTLVGLTGCHSYPLPQTPGVRASDQAEEVGPQGTLHLKPSVCAGVSLKPEIASLSVETVVAFLKARGFNIRLVNERTDLTYVDVEVVPSQWARLHVAVLGSAIQAGEDLREAIGQQGSGSWGVHRSNIAILAPAGRMDDIIAFSVKTGLACWGVLTVQRGDDAMVVPGGYLEF